MISTCDEAPYIGFRKHYSFLTVFKFHYPCEHTGCRGYVTKAVESKNSRDFSVGEPEIRFPRGKKSPAQNNNTHIEFKLRKKDWDSFSSEKNPEVVKLS